MTPGEPINRLLVAACVAAFLACANDRPPDPTAESAAPVSAQSLPPYLPTAFAIWGGNPGGVQPGQRVNFWGHSWWDQITAGGGRES